jgi:hypothetical protein
MRSVVGVNRTRISAFLTDDVLATACPRPCRIEQQQQPSRASVYSCRRLCIERSDWPRARPGPTRLGEKDTHSRIGCRQSICPIVCHKRQSPCQLVSLLNLVVWWLWLMGKQRKKNDRNQWVKLISGQLAYFNSPPASITKKKHTDELRIVECSFYISER